MTVSRRDFLSSAAVAPAAAAAVSARTRLQPFDYRGVRLLSSRWQQQFQSARDYYLGVSNDDILHGYRAAAGLPAPGKPLGGWCARNSDPVFGQWLSGMSRIYSATGDTALRDKAVLLVSEWAKTIKPDGDCRMGLYSYEKLICGLNDLHQYGGHSGAVPLLEKTLAWAMRNYSKERHPATPDRINGQPGEWYTFPENLYRAFEAIGDPKIKNFADSYLYHYYWNKFARTSAPENGHHVHAYSHVNTFSSAAKAYEISGDPVYLSIIKNFYDYLQNTQCYATGGFGPTERFVPPDGTLGRSLEARNATFEAVCGSWAGFKLSRYLTGFTGESRYGDWAERLFYNGVGAALPITTGGKHFYYADYRVTGGMKVYKVSRYSCCSGSYIQNVADYHNLIYYKDDSALYVNLYVPSEVTWGNVKLAQKTTYPETEIVSLSCDMPEPAPFTLKLRIPAWTRGASLKVNGSAINVACTPGEWAEIKRTWSPSDQVELRVPLTIRMEAVDKQHPRRVAVVRGPSVLVLDDWVFEPIPRLPNPPDVEKWLAPDGQQAGVYGLVPPDGSKVQAKFRPFYAIGEVTPYRIYHDLDSLPIPMW